MKIIRDGKEYELTHDELYMAYLEQEHEFDVNDVDSFIYDYEYNMDGDGEKIFYNKYGITVERAKANIDRIAYEKRRNIDKYDMEWRDAVTEATRTIAEEINEEEASA